MIAIQAEEGEGSGHPSEPQPLPSTTQPIHEEPIPNVVSSSHQKTQTPRQALNQVTKLPQTSEPIPNVPDEAVYEEWDDRVERATTTAASLDAEQASDNINKTQSTAMPNVSFPQGISAGGSPRCQEAMGGSIAQTRSERVPTQSYDSPLLRFNILGSDEGSMQLQELMALCTKLSDRVLALETNLRQTKKVYSAAYTKLIMKGRMIEEIDQYAGITLVTPTHSQEDQPEDQLGVLSAAKVLADTTKKNVNTYTRRRRAVSSGSGGVSTASRLFSTAEESVSTTGVSMPVSTAGMVQEVNISFPSPVVVKDKGKGIMTESKDEQTKRTKIQLEQERLSHEAAEEWENIRARVEADEVLSRRLQAEERNKYNEVDQAKMLVDLINQRKKYFDVQKAKVKRNKPMIQAQQRNYMINYIKHMGSHTLQQLKRYSFDELKELFETTIKNVNAFIPIEIKDGEEASELAAGSSQATITDSIEVGSSKRAAEVELDHEGSKKQKTNEASGEDLVKLWSLVKERFNSTEPTDDKERILWVELKRVHHVSTEKGMDIFMLVEKEYPLSKGVLMLMLVNKLLVE
ncbi:hypothetical protein Tco_0804314 [Tanacetum coccineum]|uniref:Uncharacterized protein n=1 Tax=Tanacetum coccineum TaxID=301880 RepID=A0ABQ5A6I8_9ASTR